MCHIAFQFLNQGVVLYGKWLLYFCQVLLLMKYVTKYFKTLLSHNEKIKSKYKYPLSFNFYRISY